METVYTCPMHPEVIETKPGKCPKCGMELVALTSSHKDHADKHSSMEEDFKTRFFLTLPFVFLTILLSSNIQKWFRFSLLFPNKELVLFTIGAFIFLIGGFPFFKSAKAELKAKNPGMMTLVAFAITVGFAFSTAATFLFTGESLYWEISTLISVFLFGHYLEMRAIRGTTGALSELAKLIPPSAHLFLSGNITDIKTEKLKIGNRVLVKPGEKIPVDGVVVDGESTVEESMITGESAPVSKKKGDKVIGGSLNQDGSLTIEVSKIGADSAISQIMKLIQNAKSSKPNVQHLADRAAGILFYIAVISGIASFVFWMFILPSGVVFAATVAVATVVVACPHALGLAIPTVTTITSTLGAKNGILIKDMKALEIARKINYIVFDKTGTLTKGEFGVMDVILNSVQDLNKPKKMLKQVRNDKKINEEDILRLATAVEIHSQHSIARGIVSAAKSKGIKIPDVKDFKSFPGKGAKGLVDNKKITVGNKALMEESKISNFKPQISNEKTKDKTSIYVAIDNQFAGTILLADIIRTESKMAIAKLHEMGIKIAMLTGDSKDVADKVGEELNIDTVFSQVLPGDKVDKIKLLQKDNVVAMVGDGVNDAPSLTQAHVGIAIGAGTDVAVESAGIVLMKNDPLDVVKAITLSRKTNDKMVQNLVWATGYNILAIPLAAGILYPSYKILLAPQWAALLMSASSIIVVLNALLLRKTKLQTA